MVKFKYPQHGETFVVKFPGKWTVEVFNCFTFVCTPCLTLFCDSLLVFVIEWEIIIIIIMIINDDKNKLLVDDGL